MAQQIFNNWLSCSVFHVVCDLGRCTRLQGLRPSASRLFCKLLEHPRGSDQKYEFWRVAGKAVFRAVSLTLYLMPG